MIISSKNRKARKLTLVLEEKIKHKDKEIEKIKKIYYNNKHKKRNKKGINGETSNINLNKLENSNKLENDINEDTEYNILKD